MPRDAAFQRRVIMAALALLERTDTPFIVDYPEDAPAIEDDDSLSGLACPITPGLSENERLRADLQQELERIEPLLRTAIDRGLGNATGMLGFGLRETANIVVSFLSGEPASNPRADLPLPHLLKLAVDDLGAFYTSAALAHEDSPPSPDRIAQWFWHETAAARVVHALRTRLKDHPDGLYRATSYILFAPFDYTEQPFELQVMGREFPNLIPKEA